MILKPVRECAGEKGKLYIKRKPMESLAAVSKHKGWHARKGDQSI